MPFDLNDITLPFEPKQVALGLRTSISLRTIGAPSSDHTCKELLFSHVRVPLYMCALYGQAYMCMCVHVLLSACVYAISCFYVVKSLCATTKVSLDW